MRLKGLVHSMLPIALKNLHFQITFQIHTPSTKSVSIKIFNIFPMLLGVSHTISSAALLAMSMANFAMLLEKPSRRN